MPEQDTLKQGLQQKPIQDTSQREGKKKQNPFLIILAVLLMLIFIGLVGYIAYNFGKETGKKERTEIETTENTTTEDEENDNTTTSSEEITEEEEDTTNSVISDPYEGWLTHDGRVKLKYPQDWTLSADEDNPLYFKVSVTSPDGYSFETWGADGDFGVFCIFNDTDTTNMPEVYTHGIILKSDYLSYEEFELEGENYRYAPTGEDEHTYTICRYEDSSDFYRDYIENKFFNFILPDEELDVEEMEILKEILSSVIELN